MDKNTIGDLNDRLVSFATVKLNSSHIHYFVCKMLIYITTTIVVPLKITQRTSYHLCDILAYIHRDNFCEQLNDQRFV